MKMIFFIVKLGAVIALSSITLKTTLSFDNHFKWKTNFLSDVTTLSSNTKKYINIFFKYKTNIVRVKNTTCLKIIFLKWC